VEPYQPVAVFWRATLITKHMGYNAESVELERGAHRGEFGRVTRIPALGKAIDGLTVAATPSGRRSQIAVYFFTSFSNLRSRRLASTIPGGILQGDF
jgi:hypothetical protein